MFSCPPLLSLVKRKHFLGVVISKHRLTTHDVLLCVLGHTIGVSLVLACLLAILVKRYLQVRAVQIDLHALEEEQD